MSTIEVAGSSVSPRANDQGLFQCGSCKRHYNRLDHLARHVRSHTNFKPHRCSVCGKSFSRTDLLKRHVAAHDVRNAKVNNLIRGAADETPGRVSQACRACAANHVRCTEAKPCRRCAEKGLECVYARTDDFMTPASPTTSGPQGGLLMPSPSSMPSSLDVQMAEPMLEMENERQGPPHAPQSVTGPSPTQSSLPQIVQSGATGPSSATPLAQQPFDDDFLGPPPELPTGCCTPTFAEWNFLPGLWSASDMGVSQPFPGIELNDLDLRFLDTYNVSIPFELGGFVPPPQSQPTPSMGAPAPSHPASDASEAFRNYHWRFRPNPKDHGNAEEHNLSLPSEGLDHGSPASNISFARRVTPVRLASAARDNILTIVVKSCRPDNLVKAVASFPSAELLDTLIQFYLTSPHVRAASFIHAASFNPNEKKPELLLAMAASGAVLTADPTLTKLGHAMQECVRRAIPSLWESDNTLVRDLELTQAFLVNLEIGLWSGLSRKVEITESFLQSPLTMMRRGGRFRKSSYAASILDANDQGTLDEAAWRAWVQQESYKRTAFRLVQHDLNSSMYLMVNPLVSYAELSLPLPCAPSLWTATSAQQWKSILTQSPSLAHQPPSVSDYLDDPTAFNPHAAALDRTIANEAFLACAWSLSWECIQLTSLQRTNSPTKPSVQPRRWNSFLLTSRRDELLKLLEHFRLSLPLPDDHFTSSTTPSHCNTTTVAQEPESERHGIVIARMRTELILLHLHTPFEEVQTLAGIEGPDQARAAYPAVLEWARTEQARRAICHAGQVLRFAKLVGKGMLLGPGVVGMYQAALVLWVYALLVGFHNQNHDKGVSDGGDGVRLDGEEEMARQRFMCFGLGVPFLRGREGEVSLGDPEGVLGVVIGIVRENYEGLPKPHLVERLLQLMEALQRSSAGMMDFHGQLGRQ